MRPVLLRDGPPDEPRDDHGQWTGGGGGGGGGSSGGGPGGHAAGSGIMETAKWLKSASAKEVISSVAKSEKTKEGISFALQSLLSHTTGLDASTWKLNEDLVSHTVEHFSTISEVTKLQAKSLLKTTVTKLMALRKTPAPAPAKAADTEPADEVLAALEFMLAAIDKYQPPTDEPPTDGEKAKAMGKINRAYSLLTIKSVDDASRTISGVASTPAPDRLGDVVEPNGAEFKLPLPLLWQHDSDQPIGHVTKAKVTSDGIEVVAQMATMAEPGRLKDRLDEAWQSIKSGLVQGLSIGFQPVETARIEGTFGLRFLKWIWLELSAVTIPANEQATIQTVKSLDTQQRAASGRSAVRVVDLNSPGVTGSSKTRKTPQEGTEMKTISEQITALETKRASNVAAQQNVMQKSIDAGQTTDQAQQEEFDTLQAEIEAIDKDLERLRKLEKTMASTARPVIKADNAAEGSAARAGASLVVKTPQKLEPGIGYARLVKVKMAARLTGDTPLAMAQRMYGPDSEVVGIITKANEVVAGTTVSGNWAADLVSAEGAAVAAFLEYLRPQTILGKFGAGNVPNLTRIDFYTPYVIETGGGAAYWVGEGKPKPLTAFDYDRSTLTPLKIANIAVLTEENIRYSSPNSDAIVRNALVKAIAAGLDVAFVDPANSGSSNVKPASITNGAETVVSTGDDADDIRLDVRALFQKFIDANNPPQSGVWIMSASNALALSMMVNALGQPEFTGISMNGGVFQGLPAIASQHIADVVALVNASDIFLGDEGGVAVDMSREASIEMRSTGLGMDATAGTASAASVSMFQTNSVALRAERTINWKRARTSAVAYLTSVDWGGAVPTA